MQPELAPEELDVPQAQEPTGPGPHTPPPNSSPAAAPHLLERTYLFIKEQKLKDVADALPVDYQEFEEGMLADPSNVKALHEVFKEQKWEGAELDDRQFSELLLGGLKKKAPSPAGGGVAGAIASTGGPTAGPASPTPATPTTTELPPHDEEFLPEDMPLPGGPAPVGVGDVPAEAAPTAGLVEAQDYPAYLAADPARYAAAVEEERPTLGVVPDGYERVALPQGSMGPDAEGTYMARNTQTGQRYIDRPLSDEVAGEGKQSLILAASRNINNLIADGFKGIMTGADDATRLISNATGASRGGAFGDVAEMLEKTKKPLAPLYHASNRSLLDHPNAKNLLMATSDVAGMAVPIVAQALAPEAGLGRLAARVVGTGAGLMFDGQILQGAHDRAVGAGMNPDQAAAYTFLEGGLSIALFKGGGELLGKVAGKLTPEAVKSEILRETYRLLADRGGKQLSRQELAAVLQQATAAATPRLLKIVAEGGKMGTLFGVNEAKNILTEAAARQTIGAKFTAPTLGEAVKRVAASATEGAVIGSVTGAALPAPKRTLVLGQTPEGRPVSVELSATGEPERFFDDQGDVVFDKAGPPPAVQQALAKAQEANPVPLPEGRMLSHQRVAVGAHTIAGPLFADYDLAGKPIKLYSEKGQVLTPALDDPQVRTMVEAKWPGASGEPGAAPKVTKESAAVAPENPAPALEAPATASQPNDTQAPQYFSTLSGGLKASYARSEPDDFSRIAVTPSPTNNASANFTGVDGINFERYTEAGHQYDAEYFSYERPKQGDAIYETVSPGELSLQNGKWQVVKKAVLREVIKNKIPASEPANPEPQPAATGGPASPTVSTPEPNAEPASSPTTPAEPSAATTPNEANEPAADGGAVRSGDTPPVSAPKPYATPAENRAAGAFEKDGQVYTRQAPLGERVARGKQATAEFSAGVQQPVQYAVMEAADLQPSHLGGSQNLNHFLPEAQPKNRSAAFDPASQKAITDIAAAPDPARLGEAPNAYSGAPIVNQRGEALQGNGRAAGVREHYRTGGESYRQGVVAEAEKVGIPAAETARFKEPVLVRIAEVSDAKARELGNYTAADTESGGKRRLDARQASGRLSEDGRTNLTRLATPTGDATLTETVRGNATEILRLLRKEGLVNETQLQTMVKSDGTLTPQGVEDVAALYRYQLFREGDPNLPELFAKLPSAAQGGLDRAVGALLGVPESASLVPEVQDALWGVREFLASGTDFNTWAGQADMFKGGQAPRERYSPLSLKLVELLATEKRPTYIARLFNEYAAAVKGEAASLFGETPPQSRAEATKATFGVADERASGNPRAEEGAPRPGDADQRPPAPELPAVPGADGKREAVPPANGRAAGPEEGVDSPDTALADARADALSSVAKLNLRRRLLAKTKGELELNSFATKEERQDALYSKSQLEKQIAEDIRSVRQAEWQAGNQVNNWRILDERGNPISSVVAQVEHETGQSIAPIILKSAPQPGVVRKGNTHVAPDGTSFAGAGGKARATEYVHNMGLVGRRLRDYFGDVETIEQVSRNADGTYTYITRDEKTGQPRTKQGLDPRQLLPAGEGDARASGPKFFADLAEAPPVMAQPGRIAPEPIRGEKPKAQDKIILDVKKGTGITMFFTKRPGGRKFSRALGSYNPRNAAVAIRASADLDVTAHELGHALDDYHDLLPKAPTPALAEIQPLAGFGSQPPAGHPDPANYRSGEALAEFVRAYLVNPTATKAAYPAFTAHYEATVPVKLRTAVDSFGRDIRVFAGATAHEQVMSNVRMKPAEKGGIMSVLRPDTQGKKFYLTFADRVGATMFNAMRPFEKAMNYARDIAGPRELLPEQNPNVLARLFLGLNDKMDNMMRNGLVDSRNERRIDQQTGEVKNLTWLLDPLDKTTEGTIAHEQELVVSAKVAARTVELVERRVADDIEAALGRGEHVDPALLARKPEWQTKFGADNAKNQQANGALATIDEHQADTVSGIGAGIFTDLDVARARLADHAALQASNPEQYARIEEAGRRLDSWADDNLKYLVERGRMSQEQYDAIKENNAQYIAMQRVMEAEPGAEIALFGRGPGGKNFTVVKQPLQKITGSGRTIKNPYSSLLDATYTVTREGDRNAIMQAMRELFVGGRPMNDGAVEELGAVARPAAEGDPNTVSVFVNGQREYWQLDADVFQALNEMANTPLSGLMGRIMQKPSAILRWSVTHSPVFAVRNVIRDTRSRLIISTNTPENGFDVLTNKQVRQDARDGLDLAGGGQAGHYLRDETAYYETMQGEMRRLAKDKRFILADPARLAKEGWQKYTAALGQSETIGRLQEYRAAFKKARRLGMDDYNASLYAAHEARDLMDFAVAGTFLREVNKYVPFTNAAVQGLRRAAKSAGQNPGGFAMRWALYSLAPTLLVRGLVHQMGRDEEYAQLPAYQRDGFDNIPLPKGKWLVIPRPFELGTMAASADRFLSQQVADDPQAWAGYGGSLAKSFVPADESAVAGGLKPVVEVLTNHDFFKDKTIISPSEAKLDVSLRHTERGSRLGQWIGGAVGMDSRNVDHLISGTASYYGNWLMKASNFGRTDGAQGFGLPDTGFIKEQPVTQARDVQWLQQRLEGVGLGQSKPARDLDKLLEFYYAQTTEQGKRQAGELVTEYAVGLRRFLDDELLKQAGRVKKAQRDARKP